MGLLLIEASRSRADRLPPAALGGRLSLHAIHVSAGWVAWASTSRHSDSANQVLLPSQKEAGVQRAAPAGHLLSFRRLLKGKSEKEKVPSKLPSCTAPTTFRRMVARGQKPKSKISSLSCTQKLPRAVLARGNQLYFIFCAQASTKAVNRLFATLSPRPRISGCHCTPITNFLPG